MSLAAQLSKVISLNAPLLADRSRRKHAESYLFASREADQHDFLSIHALGVNGLSRLKALDAKFAKYDGNLFSDAARGLDRTLQSESQNVELDRTISLFLKDLGPYLLEAPASKALEWVVRRFRVNEFNIDAVMGLFLPYHETAHFTKMVSILHVKDSSLWSFLSPLKAAAKPLPRSMLVDEMVANIDLARFVLALLPEALGAGRTYRTLIGFSASVTVDYLTRLKKVDEEVVAFVLPALTRTFAHDSNQDCTLAGYVALAMLSQRCGLGPSVLMAIITEMIKGRRHIKTQQILPFLVAVLGPQERLDDFQDVIVGSLMSLPSVIDSLKDCLSWAGADKLLLPLLPSLVQRTSEASTSSALESLLQSPLVPSSIVKRSTELLLKKMLQQTDQSSRTALSLLTVIYQRHGDVFSATFSKLLAVMGDVNDRQTLEGIIRSIALPPSTSGHGELILSSSTVDVSSRVTAVRELVKALGASDIGPENQGDVYDALRARVADTNVTVIETLYSDSRAILPVFCNLPFIEAVSAALNTPDISRSIMRLHFAFIAGNLHNQSPELAPAIFEHVYIPYILFTKPRHKTATLVWQSLKDTKLAHYELFAGCADIAFAHLVTDEVSQSTEAMAELNLAVTERIAGNIVASNAYPRHLDMLLRLLSSSDAHTTNVCYLILRSVLSQLSGEHQVDAALRILSSMALQSLDALNGVVGNIASLKDAISDGALLKSVVLKPSSIGTMHRLQIAILALLPVVQQPLGAKIDWLGDGPLINQSSSDARGKRFVELAHALYTLVNSSPITQFLSTSLLKALFVNLRERALLFLAGIWTASLLSDTDSADLPHAALFHAAAFLRAQTTDTDHPQDFQVILPSLLIALQSRHRTVRSAAMDCITIISQSAGSSTVSPAIYALDSAYGNSFDGLQYLDWPDLSRYVTSLETRREHFINDGSYFCVFSQEVLRKSRSDNKKEVGYKHRILCYILSHVLTWTSVRARIALLEILRNTPHRAKLQMLLPLLQSIVSGDQSRLPWDEKDASLGTTYVRLLLEAYDITAVPDLIEPGSRSWATFVRILPLAFTGGVVLASTRKTILQQLCSGLFESLTVNLKREICVILIESASMSSDSYAMIKEAMGFFLKEASVIASLLAHFQPTSKDNSQRAPKRTRLALGSETDAIESSLHPMTVLVEIFVAHPMPGSVELMSSVLDALARVFHAHSSQSDANYLMQLLISMLESIASSIADTATLAPNTVRMEILVELLRVSDNPQTFNQTLLLIANLARLAPEFVMQNVMPVFTFMGSNVFHRDDTYSFRVVQKTIDSIVPVVITSLKRKHPGSLGLQLASKEFLRLFTDAATHIPRHRRTQFFNHLVEALDHDEFTVSICLLLVDKVANRVVRKKPEEAAIALSLPLSILQAKFKVTPFKVIEQLLQEATVLLSRITNPNSTTQDTFLEPVQDGDQTSSTSTKRQIQAIIIFVDLTLQQSSRRAAPHGEPAIQESVRLLLAMTNPLDPECAPSPELAEVSRAATKALGHLLRVISVIEFASTIGAILASSNVTIEMGAMNLLATRIANITPKTRQEISPTITDIIEYICNKSKVSQGVPTYRSFLNALCAVAQTADNREMPFLTKALPVVLEVAANQKSLTADVLRCIVPLSAKIGPRILPFFHDVVGFCSDVLDDSQPLLDAIEQNAQAVLLALLSSMSQFWGVDELVRLSELSMGTRPASLSIRKTLAKRIPGKQMLPALFRLWSKLTSAHSSWSSREAFFDLLKRVIRNASRDDIHDQLRDIFKLFLEAFDMCNETSRQDAEKYEDIALATFVEVVTKLNEAAFKPLFRRLFDWAFHDAAGKSVDRQVTFCRLLTALIRLLKGLITPYMGVVLPSLTELLDAYHLDSKQPVPLWTSAIELFHASLSQDDGAFWRTDKLRKLIPTLVGQVKVCSSFNIDDARHILKRCLGALVSTMDDDSSLKQLNLELLMQTRSDDAQVRLLALECTEHVWNGHGDKLSGFVSDVVTFIAECAEDEHDEVAKAARGLKKTIEKKCGSLDVLMQ